MKYYLFSATARCAPCRVLVNRLNAELPTWKDFIEYVDVDDCTPEQHAIAMLTGIRSIPVLTTSTEIVPNGSSFNKIKELCTLV